MNKFKSIGRPARLLLACLLAASGLAAASAMGQAEEAKLTREEVVAKAWQAMFGARRDADIRSISLEGYFHGRPEPNRTTVKRPNLFRNEVKSGVLVFDGKRAAWAKREPDEAGNARGPELIEPKSWRHFEVDIAIVFPAFFEYPAELQGSEKVNGADAYKLHVPLPLGGSVTYFVDGKSFLVVKRIVCWDGDPKDPWENLVEGYSDHDGILFPDGYSFAGREGRQQAIYKNVRFNVEPADDLFKLPEGLK